MSEPVKKTQDFTHPASKTRTPRENAADEVEVVEEESSHADAQAKAEAKHVPPETLSKSQRKRL